VLKLWRGGGRRLSTAFDMESYSMPITIKVTYRRYEALLREGGVPLDGAPCP
jgi:hypothetical protein